MNISIARIINTQGNNAIQYTDDLKAYGKADWWEVARRMKIDLIVGKILDDCDGYAAWKYDKMKEAGADIESLAMVICMYIPDNLGHMVLAWYEYKDDPWILDNIDTIVWKASQRTDLKPIVSFNEDRIFSYD